MNEELKHYTIDNRLEIWEEVLIKLKAARFKFSTHSEIGLCCLVHEIIKLKIGSGILKDDKHTILEFEKILFEDLLDYRPAKSELGGYWWSPTDVNARIEVVEKVLVGLRNLKMKSNDVTRSIESSDLENP